MIENPPNAKPARNQTKNLSKNFDANEFLPVKNVNDNVQRFLFKGIGPPSSVPDVKPTPIAKLTILQINRRTSRSTSV
jgi:hypothetical protein